MLVHSLHVRSIDTLVMFTVTMLPNSRLRRDEHRAAMNTYKKKLACERALTHWQTRMLSYRNQVGLIQGHSLTETFSLLRQRYNKTS